MSNIETYLIKQTSATVWYFSASDILVVSNCLNTFNAANTNIPLDGRGAAKTSFPKSNKRNTWLKKIEIKHQVLTFSMDFQ